MPEETFHSVILVCVSWLRATSNYDADKLTTVEINGQMVYTNANTRWGIIMQTLDDEYCQVDTNKYYAKDYNSLATAIDALRTGTYITGACNCAFDDMRSNRIHIPHISTKQSSV